MFNVAAIQQRPFSVTDELEQTLIAAGGLYEKYGARLHLDIEAQAGSYPVTLTTSGDWRLNHPYFRAGKYLVLDPNLLCFGGHAEESELDEVAFIESCKSISEVIFLCDNKHPSLHLNTDIHARNYYLPNTIGCMVALQELTEQLQGRTIIDIGSRNALLAETALREGAEQALAIECESETAHLFRPQLFPDIDADSTIEMDRMDLNAKVNGSSERIEILNSTFGKIPVRHMNGGVAVFNFIDYGMGYYDASLADLEAAENRLSNGRFMNYDDSIKARESLIADVTEKFPGLKYIVASGGSRLRGRHELMIDKSAKLLQEAERIGWRHLQTIVVAHPSKGIVMDLDLDDWNDPKHNVDDTCEYLTFVFEKD